MDVDELSESGERDIGVLNAIRANYIEKIVVSSRSPETNVDINSHYPPVKTLTLVPQLSRVPIFVENGRPSTSTGGSIVESDTVAKVANESGKTVKGRNSPPRPPTTSTPSRVGTASRPKTSNRVLTSNGPNNNPVSNQTAALTNVSPVKQANIENRIIIRLANMLPVDSEAQDPTSGQTHQSQPQQHSYAQSSSQFSKLPESRNSLLRLNRDLDDIMTDIRNYSLEMERFSFGDMSSQDKQKDYLPGTSLDNNPLVFDQVIAELSAQASRKVVRIKKLYRNQMQKLKKQYEGHVAELKMKADKLSSRLFEANIQSDSISNAVQFADGDVASSTGPNDALHQHQRLVKVLREEQDSMQEVLLQRLENERKLSLEKIIELDAQLQNAKTELLEAKGQIAKLSSQLLDRENVQLEKDRETVVNLSENIKELIRMSQVVTGK